MQSESEQSSTQEQRAAILVDYENLYELLNHQINQRTNPDELISEMLDELRRYLQEEHQTQTALIFAYADFGELKGNGQYIQRALYLQGAEPRFVPATLQKNAAEIQLCVDAVDILHNRPDIQTFVLLTGNRAYLPLVQQFKRHGCQTLVASMDPPPATDTVQYVEDDVFFDAFNLLDEASRQLLRPRPSDSGSGSAREARSVAYQELTTPGTHLALEIIEEHFGQYEEVYLTPLLRKMSELLDENRFDPKTLISTLEEAGAIWLEKRRGFPYDYTVLLVDENHPEVREIQQKVYEHGQHSPSNGRSAYSDEEYDEYDDEYDYYQEDFDEDDDYEAYDEVPEEAYDEAPEETYDEADDYDEVSEPEMTGEYLDEDSGEHAEPDALPDAVDPEEERS